MKLVLVIVSVFSVAGFAGEARNVSVVGQSKNSVNVASGSRNIAKQSIQSVDVTGKAKNITINASAKNSVNVATGSGNTAIQRIQSVDVAGNAGNISISGRVKNAINVAHGSGAYAEQNIQSVIVPAGTTIGNVHIGGNIDGTIVNVANSDTSVQNVGSVIAR